jgi:hypothetical protein
VEPYIFPPNDVMANIPDRFEITYEVLLDILKKGHSFQVGINELMEYLVTPSSPQISSEDKYLLRNFFEVKIPPDLVVNFREGTMNGVIEFVKKKPQLDDEDIKAHVAYCATYALSGSAFPKDALPRINEIMDLLNCSDYRSSRSVHYKMDALKTALKNIILEDKWRVRNTQLFVKSADWIRDYIANGNLASLSNFTRLKCMTHKGNAIYSMDETT